MKVEIISIGTEILLGDILNTNSQYLSKELALLGLDVYNQQVVGDNEERILEAFELAFSRSDLVITTGGLGPTDDDMTKEVASKYFDKELVEHKKSKEKIEEYFKSMGKNMPKNNLKQALYPKESIVVENNNGTAPGIIIEEKDKIMIIIPGPPNEMKPMFEESIKPYLNNKTNTTLVSKVIKIIGVGESSVAEKIKDIIDNQTNPTVAPYAKDGEVELRITAKSYEESVGLKLIEPILNDIRERLNDNIYSINNETIEEALGKMLINKGLTLASAESCTGGLIASKLVSYPGISEVFMEGAVTYSNEAKIRRLNVKKETLDKYGAVSEQVAIEMAEGISKTSKTDIGIATTGIAGPGGGTAEKPVGLVYIGICINGKAYAKRYVFKGNRAKVRNSATIAALDMIRREVEKTF
ncbi:MULTISPECIES: competence/damage-inducible protein A [unclassified Clostridium]|uniref:competence/damage-inducible protein A n=1 Tax=unclassified Clostridium TaxID=2614128 RepID=UPI0013F018C6|nr:MULTISPECIES: competence/damage-inducible protein A [unclassified Clostridium]NFG63069.1 competence/damage-inducible protein A [Clostridium botulinum]NFQ07999.1 competence/damage-inducible protein A [Clostridium botulinum]